MIGHRVAISFYRILLRVYPASFRRAVGPDLVADFGEGLRRSSAQGGAGHAARFTLRQLVDLLRNTTGEWRAPSGPEQPGAPRGMGARLRAATEDLRFAVRSLRRDPTFTTTALAIVGVGFAALITVYAMVDAILLEPMPYPDASRLVSMTESYRVTQRKSVAYPNLLDWRERNRTLEGLAARNWASFNLTGQGNARSVQGMGATADLMPLLGVSPLRGRLFSVAEAADRAHVVLISEGFWRDTLGADTAAVGRELRLDGESYTIVGVLPHQQEFPLSGAELWVPLPAVLSDNNLVDRSNHPGIEAFGRLRDGVSLETAQADLDRVAGELAAEYPDANGEAGVVVRPLRGRLVDRSAATLWMLLAAVALMGLGICANVASLMLARATRRHGEIAVRAALGAGRGRLTRQLLAEGTVLALLGAAVGLTGAIAATGWIRTADGLGLPRLSTLEVDASVAGFALAAAALAGLFIAGAAALRLTRADPAATLRGNAAGRSVTQRGQRGRTTLVVAQIGLAVMLLAGAGLMLRTLDNLIDADLGISPGVLVTGYLGPPQTDYPTTAERADLYRRYADAVAGLPGVRRVAGGNPLPMSGRDNQWTLSNDGFPHFDDSGLRVDVARVMPAYFDVMGVRIQEGRDFREDDTEDSPVVIVDRTLADFLFPDGDALGNRLRFRGPAEDRPWHTIVGIVDHVKNYGVRNESRYELYMPYRLVAWGMDMVVEAESEAAIETIVAGMRDELARLDPELPLTRVNTMRGYIDESIASETLLARTLGGFAAAALLVAVIGLYGVIAYSVTLRRREFGIRMALGAGQGNVLRGVLREGLTLTAMGIAAGLTGALAGGRLLAGLLYGVAPTDPATLGGVSALMAVVAVLACTVPARQALRVDPGIALRD